MLDKKDNEIFGLLSEKYKEQTLKKVRQKALLIQPMQVYCSILKVESRGFKRLVLVNQELQETIIEAELETYEKEFNEFQTIRRAFRSRSPLEVRVKGQESKKIEVGNAQIAEAYKAWDMFMQIFNRNSVCALLNKIDEKVIFAQIEKQFTEPEGKFSEIRKSIIQNLDKAVGITGRAKGNLTFSPEHLKAIKPINKKTKKD